MQRKAIQYYTKIIKAYKYETYKIEKNETILTIKIKHVTKETNGKSFKCMI